MTQAEDMAFTEFTSQCTFACPLKNSCQWEGRSSSSFEAHMTAVHAGMASCDGISVRAVYQCKICLERVTQDLKHLEAHMTSRHRITARQYYRFVLEAAASLTKVPLEALEKTAVQDKQAAETDSVEESKEEKKEEQIPAHVLDKMVNKWAKSVQNHQKNTFSQRY